MTTEQRVSIIRKRLGEAAEVAKTMRANYECTTDTALKAMWKERMDHWDGEIGRYQSLLDQELARV